MLHQDKCQLPFRDTSAKLLSCWMVPAFLLEVVSAAGLPDATPGHIGKCEHMDYFQYTLLGTELLISGSWGFF